MVHLAVYRDRLVCSLEADVPPDEMCVEARMLLEVGIVWMASKSTRRLIIVLDSRLISPTSQAMAISML